MRFYWGERDGKEASFVRAATAGPAAPRRTALPGHPLIVLVLRLRLGEGLAREARLGVEGLPRGVFVPCRRIIRGRLYRRLRFGLRRHGL
jgi:hypothetical protein